MPFFAAFPKILYDIENAQLPNFEIITNITYRIGVIKSVLENLSAYYYYNITDADKPELLAEKVYGDPTAYWIILYANNIYDPQYDWPLNYKSFGNYMANKYKNQAVSDQSYWLSLNPPQLNINTNTITNNQVISWTKNKTIGTNSIHHYEKIILILIPILYSFQNT